MNNRPRDERGRFVKSEEKAERGKEKVYAVGFKGFEPGLICRGKRYSENSIFEEPKAELCECGMHFCEDPLDVFNYYSPAQHGRIADFATVEALAPCKGDGDKKVTTKLRIGSKLTLGGLSDAAIMLRFKLVKWKGKHNTDRCGAASATGDCGAASATGDCGAASATGNFGAASATGYRGAASATGYRGAASATGNFGAASATGNRGAASATGASSFAVSTGANSKVKGAKGCFIACAEWKQKANGEWYPVAFVSAKVDGKKIKANKWYTVKNGKFVEVEE